MLNGCWRACVDRDEETGDVFIAEAIISNPPAFAHIHCAQSLGIPLHMSFSMCQHQIMPVLDLLYFSDAVVGPINQNLLIVSRPLSQDSDNKISSSSGQRQPL
jgi:hypothetical protein